MDSSFELVAQATCEKRIVVELNEELNEFQLVLVGGGCGDVVFA